jgi:hypothetical protein
MPDRCEVLPGDSIVARRGGGLLWVDAPGSPALVAALHACVGVTGPGADRVLAGVAGQVSSLAHGGASFALVLTDSAAGTGVALWSGKGQPAVDGVPLSGSSVEGCSLASGFSLGQTVYVGPGQAAPQMPPGVSLDLVEGTVPGSGAMLQLTAAPAIAAPAPTAAAPSSPFTAGSDAGFGSAPRAAAAPVESRPDSGEQTAFWRPDEPAAPVLRFDDGMVVTVDEDLVLGRRPDNHELVTSGQARPVPIADTQNVLSSAHAALQRNGREVSLVDLGSLNGTHVAGPEATEWTQLEPGVAHPLSDGDRLLLGWTVITFEQPQD